MDIRVLRYFLAAAEQQSISGAAQKLHVTQPTLSRQFMELEEELGHTLFVRSNRKLRLTPKGELFYERARSIVNLIDRTKEEIRAEDELTGDIRIAAGETPALGSLARAIARLQKEAPKVRFHIVSGAEAQVKSELHSGLTDFGVFVGIADTIGYSSIKLRQKDVWGVLTRIDGPFAGKKQIEASDLAGQPLLCSEQSFSRNEFAVSRMKDRNGKKIEPYSKDKVDALLKQYGIELKKDKGYDCVYVCNMALSDYFGSSI